MAIRDFAVRNSLKRQVLLMFFSLLLTISVVSCAIFYKTLSIYTDELHGQAADNLNLLMASVERELSRAEKLSLNIATNPNVIRNLSLVLGGGPLLQRFDAYSHVQGEIAKYADLDSYVESISILSLRGEKVAGIADRDGFGSAKREKILAAMDDASQNSWICLEDFGIMHISAFSGDMGLGGASSSSAGSGGAGSGSASPGGTGSGSADSSSASSSGAGPGAMHGLIVTRINMDKLADGLKRLLGQETNLIVQRGEERIFSNMPYGGEWLGAKGDGIARVGDRRYFCVSDVSALTLWDYRVFLPYDSQLSKIRMMQFLTVAVFLAGILASIALIFLFSRSLLKSFSLLSANMRRFLNGNFEVDQLAAPVANAKNEVYVLYNEFHGIATRMNGLIKENYTKQLQLKETELQMLYSQFNAHFIYNTLDSIYWLSIAARQDTVARMVKALAALLRRAMPGNEYLVTVAEEFRLLEEYTTIQKIRHAEKLRVRFRLPEQLLSCRIPPMSLQPIVENSIVHVLEKQRGVCEIEVDGEQRGGAVEISVRDNGPGIEGDIASFRGNGLKNVDRRLRSVFGDGFGLHIRENRSVAIRIPAESAESAAAPAERTATAIPADRTVAAAPAESATPRGRTWP
jgi:two-component system sensor histidine kinase YesM